MATSGFRAARGCVLRALRVGGVGDRIRGTLGAIDPPNKVPVSESQKKVKKGSLLRVPLILPRMCRVVSCATPKLGVGLGGALEKFDMCRAS